jgi:hypothetical protein
MPSNTLLNNNDESSDSFIELFLGMSKYWYITEHIKRRVSKRSKELIGLKRILTKKQENYITGIIGEEHFPSNCRASLRELDLKETQKLSYNTFCLQSKKKQGGADFYLRVNYGGEIYRLLIEVKSWKKLAYCTDKMFRGKILDRYTSVDPEHLYCWVLAINKRNIPVLKEICDRYHIHILPMNEHYTRPFLRKLIKENRIMKNPNPENIFES